MTDFEAVRSTIIKHLPIRTRWLLDDTPLDTNLARSLNPLRPLQSDEVNNSVLDPRWANVYLFGEQDYAEGGGACPFLGVERNTGEVLGLDIERDPPSTMYFLNSDVDCFIRTFRALDIALRSDGIPSEMLLVALTEADPRGFERSEWRIMVEGLLRS